MAHRLAALRDFATKRTVKQFATKHQLVYFGYVDARDDDHELVRGLTASTSHHDTNYCVGTFNSHDITLVQRRNTLKFPGKPESTYNWLIMSVDLKRGGFPHVFIDAHHHDATFYANLAVGFTKLQSLPATPAGFAAGTRILTPLDTHQKVTAMFTPEVAGTITHHFRYFDYEIHDDQLYVYASNQHVTSVLLGDMLRVSLWLADYLNRLPAEL